MCGISGFLQSCLDSSLAPVAIEAMTSSLAHRGPDDTGYWLDCESGIALGHRRLSIVDLSPYGHQPMASASGRYQIVFNGEIYNFRFLRKELENLDHMFRGHSDTEVMLAAFEEWGVESAVKRFTGMFAFALWDKKTRLLYLVRDRMGEKPLYYGWVNNVFLFGSELKALRAHPAWNAEINRDALTLLMRHTYIPAPYSIYNGIYKLMPGTILTVNLSQPDKQPEPVPYWSARSVAESGQKTPFIGSDTEAADRLEEVLSEAISAQMLADVPLGAFLSGGIDSSTVVALMQAQSGQPVRTFTIGFNEAGYNEAPYAREVARHLGTDHTELYVTPDEALDVIPRLPMLYDEPFSDSSQIPTFLVSQMARKHVTVALCGDGGDELFCGYTRYETTQDVLGKKRYLPSFARTPIARALKSVPARRWNACLKWARPLLSRYGNTSIGNKIHAAAFILNAPPEAVYLRLISLWHTPGDLVIGGTEPPTVYTDPGRWAALHDFHEKMMYWDMCSYLPDDILVKTDRASMGVSLESREPLLDHRVVEFAWRLPLHMKRRNNQNKWLLRQVLYRHVPRELIERPKMGFGVPVGEWLRGPLRGWAEELLDEQRLKNEGFFNPESIRTIWKEHLKGDSNWQHKLWGVLMFQAWLGEK